LRAEEREDVGEREEWWEGEEEFVDVYVLRGVFGA